MSTLALGNIHPSRANIINVDINPNQQLCNISISNLSFGDKQIWQLAILALLDGETFQTNLRNKFWISGRGEGLPIEIRFVDTWFSHRAFSAPIHFHEILWSVWFRRPFRNWSSRIYYNILKEITTRTKIK